jgi:hydrogenase maturation protease
LRRVLVVGCEPGRLADGIGLSEPVAAAVDPAARLVRDLVEQLLGTPGPIEPYDWPEPAQAER